MCAHTHTHTHTHTQSSSSSTGTVVPKVYTCEIQVKKKWERVHLMLRFLKMQASNNFTFTYVCCIKYILSQEGFMYIYKTLLRQVPLKMKFCWRQKVVHALSLRFCFLKMRKSNLDGPINSQDSVHKPHFLKRKECRSGSNRGPYAYQPSALPIGHTGSRAALRSP